MSDEMKDLKECLGSDGFEKIINMFGGTKIYIPKRPIFERNERNRNIKKEFSNSGLTIKEIAKKYDISINSVYRILNS